MAASQRTLFRLFYRSRQTPEAAADLDIIVRQVIESSIPNNLAVGLTGLLLTVHGHFIQALEGDINAVRSTYARISMDPRHYDQRIISQGPAERRLFGDWNMCASSLASSDKAIISVLDGKRDFDPQALTAASIQRLLTNVADIKRRTAVASFIV